MRSIRARLSLLAGAATLLGCSSELPAPIPAASDDAAPPRRGGTITMASFADVRSLDPANLTDGLAPQIMQELYAGLVDYDDAGKIIPALAERWTIEDGGTSYTFVLREGAKFHDGDEVTAADVVRSVERALHPSAPNPYSTYFAGVAGYDAFTAKKSEHLAGVSAEGRYVVRFRLAQPDATFLPLLALQVLRPVCKSAGDRYADTWTPCGAGPFKLPPGGWEQGHHVDLVRHDGYFAPGLPYLDGVKFVFKVNQTSQKYKLLKGELDVYRDFLLPDLLRFQADPRWKPFGEFEKEKAIAGISMNCEMAPFDNVEIRRAVVLAVDREEIRLLRAANLRVADQLVPPTVFGYDPANAGPKKDLAAALEHMRLAGYPFDPATGKGGWPETITYTTYNQGLDEYVGQVIQQQLAKIGLRIELRVVNYPTFIALRGRRKTTALGSGSWQQDFPDALSFLEPLFHSRSINDEDSNNWSFYSNPKFDALVDASRREVDDTKRKKLYDQAQAVLRDDAPWAFLYNYRLYEQRQPYVRGYHAHPMWTTDVTRVWIDRASGGTAGRSIFQRDALGALFGDR